MAFGKDNDPNVGKNTQFQPGQSGNPNGRPKGSKHLSTWIKEMLNDEEFELFLSHPTEGFKKFKGAPGKAIVTTAITRAANGDDKWANWLGKFGEGSKVTHANDPENPITSEQLPDKLVGKFVDYLKEETSGKDK